MRLPAAQSEDELKKNFMNVDVMIEMSANAAAPMKPQVDSLFRPSPQDPQLVCVCPPGAPGRGARQRRLGQSARSVAVDRSGSRLSLYRDASEYPPLV